MVLDVRVADFNRDGLLDLVASLDNGDVVFYNQGPVNNWSEVHREAGGSAKIEVADLNQDGWPDVYNAHFYSGSSSVTAWLNPGARVYVEAAAREARPAVPAGWQLARETTAGDAHALLYDTP